MTDRTNYNNNNNNIITVKNNMFNDRAEPPQRSSNGTAPTSSSSSDLTSRSGVRQTRRLPNAWQWFKVDLYDTGTGPRTHHKLSINICKAGEIRRFKSLNNSPWRLFKRGYGVEVKADPHYQTVSALRDELRADGYDPRVSKCYVSGYQGGKASMTKGLSTLLITQPQPHTYSMALVLETEVIWCALNGGAGTLSDAQRRQHIVATGTVHGESAVYGNRIGDIL